MSDLHELGAPYALDALDDDERVAFERHLEGCAECRADLEVLLASAAHMAAISAVDPPRALKESVMAKIARRPSADVVALSWYRRPWVGALAAAAVVVALVATVGALRSDRAPSASEIIAAADAQSVSLEGDGVEATFIFSFDQAHGVFRSSSLSALGDREIYELWLIDDGEPTPAGLFLPSSAGLSEAIVSNIRPGLTIGLTIEPEGGSPEPTGDVLLAALIG